MLSISRNAAEWLADLNDSVTLLLSPMANVLNGDTECYTVRNTHDCSQVYVKEATGPDTPHVMPAGSFEIEMTLVDEYQMKNA